MFLFEFVSTNILKNIYFLQVDCSDVEELVKQVALRS